MYTDINISNELCLYKVPAPNVLKIIPLPTYTITKVFLRGKKQKQKTILWVNLSIPK